MPGSGKRPLYNEKGQVIGDVTAYAVEYAGHFIVQCPNPKSHLYLIAAEVLRQPDPPECPVCVKRERNGDA